MQTYKFICLSAVLSLFCACHPSDPKEPLSQNTSENQFTQPEVESASLPKKTIEQQLTYHETSVVEANKSLSSVPELIPAADKGEKGARNIALAWASYLEQGRFDEAYALVQNLPEQDQTQADYAAYWKDLGKLSVSLGGGQIESGAGSLYYQIPVSVSALGDAGKASTLIGTMLLRRVNDVPGATSEQLRWHITQLDLAKN